MRNGLCWLLGALLVGCGGSATREAASPQAKVGSGAPDDPIVTCGPKESYAYIANDFRCPDGSNPFAGDLDRAADSRAGSLAQTLNGHIIDRYEVPCSTGKVAVHVDLYGCEEYARRLTARDSQQNEALKALFRAGEFDRVVSECPGPGDESSAVDARTWCTAMVPASLHVLGRHEQALPIITKFCTMMPAAGPKSDGRASYLTMIMMMLSEAHQTGHFDVSNAEREALLQSWLEACRVPKEQIEETIQRSQSEQ